jgi:hypothetical protein
MMLTEKWPVLGGMGVPELVGRIIKVAPLMATLQGNVGGGGD